MLGLVEAFVAQGRGRHPTFVSLDTLHLTHCMRPGIASWPDVQETDRRLASLGARLVYLRARPETLWQRTVWERRETGFLRDYAMRRFGGTLEAVHEYFVREQERMLALVDMSRLTKIVLDAEQDPAELAACALRWWTGD